MSAGRKRHKKTERKRPSKAKTKPHAIAPAEAAALPPGLRPTSETASRKSPRKSESRDDLRSLIEEARTCLAVAVSAEIVMLNRQLGQRTWGEFLGEQHMEYGKQIVDALSRQLTVEEVKALSSSITSAKGSIEKDGE